MKFGWLLPNTPIILMVNPNENWIQCVISTWINYWTLIYDALATLLWCLVFMQFFKRCHHGVITLRGGHISEHPPESQSSSHPVRILNGNICGTYLKSPFRSYQCCDIYCLFWRVPNSCFEVKNSIYCEVQANTQEGREIAFYFKGQKFVIQISTNFWNYCKFCP